MRPCSAPDIGSIDRHACVRQETVRPGPHRRPRAGELLYRVGPVSNATATFGVYPVLFAHCLFCERPFAACDALGGFACGRRVAWDPARGRLWAICDACHRWTLAPFEDRLQVIGALERMARDRGRLALQTANVALLYADPLVLLRVGRASLPEQSWWRYGRELRRRRHLYESRGSRVSAYSFAAVASLSESIGLTDTGLKIAWDAAPVADILRWRHFSTAAWRGRVRCLHCNSVLLALRFDLSWWVRPLVDENGDIALGVPCDRCDPWTPEKVYRIAGGEAEEALRRVLAYQNIAGASERMLNEATREIENAGSALEYARLLPGRRASLWKLGPVRTLALEVALNERMERRALEREVRELENAWQREEEVARIIDEELEDAGTITGTRTPG